MTRSRPGHGRFRPRRWAFLLALAALGVLAFDLFLPAGPFPPHERRVVLVQRGQNLRQITGEMKRVGLLHGTLSFQILARLLRVDRHVKAGQYAFRLGTTVPELLRLFGRGMGGLSLVTIPEGLTLTEVSLLLSNHLGVPAMAFDSLGHDRAFLDSLGLPTPNIEGYLAPESYEFLPGTSPEVAFRTMVQRQLGILAQERADHDSLPLPVTPLEALTLASIVESEAQVADERPRIARVYLNRLVRGMRLQADPTVAYSLGMHPRSRLFIRQLRYESPYNTYLFEGLPPGPICSPGRASIAAVYHPKGSPRELYFVARGEGRHWFAETYEQHLANIHLARAAHALADTAAVVAESTATPAPAPGKVAAAKPGAAGASEAAGKPEKSGAAARSGASEAAGKPGKSGSAAHRKPPTARKHVPPAAPARKSAPASPK